jgi:hypothetical protein
MSGLRKFRAFPVIRLLLGHRRGRLVGHYFFVSALLISCGLAASGLLEIYFRYHESREHLALLQQEAASGAAFKIERFIQEIERTMKAATRSREIVPKGLSGEYKFELEKLLLIAPAITEVVALDEQGAVQVQASRLRTVLPAAVRSRVGVRIRVRVRGRRRGRRVRAGGCASEC